MLSVRGMLMRGGTSKGMYFLRDDLDATGVELEALLPRIMGSPDQRQIDGIGGGTSTTSKVAIISPSERPGCDVDYLFAQVGVHDGRVDWTPTCGNLLVGVAPFALERGIITAGSPTTHLRINLVNTGAVVDSTLDTPRGYFEYSGPHAIDGVPGTAAPVHLVFNDFAGGTTGSLYPTGQSVQEIDGVPITAIDAGVAAVIIRASDLGLVGDESPDVLNANSDVIRAISRLRIQAGFTMGLGDVRTSVVPKVMLVSANADGILRSRYFVPHTCHPAHAVSGAICLATARASGGTILDSLPLSALSDPVLIEHPSGTIELGIDITSDGPVATIHRTARKLFDGEVFAELSRSASR